MSETTPSTPTSSARRRTLIITGGTVGVAAVAVTAFVVVNNTAEAEVKPPGGQTIMLIEETLPPDLVLADPSEIETLGEPMDLEVLEWQTELQSEFYGNPNLGALAISPDRTVFTITWYGTPSAALQQQIAAAPVGLDVVIQSAAFPPGEMQQLITEAMEPGVIPGVEIAVGGVENDGSGIHLGIVELPEGKTVSEIADMISAALGNTDVPIRVEVTGAVVPIAG